jgi:hypothetical protein
VEGSQKVLVEGLRGYRYYGGWDNTSTETGTDGQQNQQPSADLRVEHNDGLSDYQENG